MPSHLPLSAYDPRLLAAWRAGASSPMILATASADDRERCNRLIKLSQLLHEVRSAAKRTRAPGWESLYTVVQRKRYERGRLVEIRLEPRTHATDDLLANVPLDTTPPLATEPSPVDLPDDFLVDIFGPPPPASA